MQGIILYNKNRDYGVNSSSFPIMKGYAKRVVKREKDGQQQKGFYFLKDVEKEFTERMNKVRNLISTHHKRNILSKSFSTTKNNTTEPQFRPKKFNLSATKEIAISSAICKSITYRQKRNSCDQGRWKKRERELSNKSNVNKYKYGPTKNYYKTQVCEPEEEKSPNVFELNSLKFIANARKSSQSFHKTEQNLIEEEKEEKLKKSKFIPIRNIILPIITGGEEDNGQMQFKRTEKILIHLDPHIENNNFNSICSYRNQSQKVKNVIRSQKKKKSLKMHFTKHNHSLLFYQSERKNYLSLQKNDDQNYTIDAWESKEQQAL